MFKSKYFIIIYFIMSVILVTTFSWLATTSNYQTNNTIIPIVSPMEIQRSLLLELIDSYNPNLYKTQKTALCNTILSEAKHTGLHPFFISSVIAAESSFNPDAVSPCAAMGLMQLTSCVLEELHIKQPFNIQANIYGGTRFLKYLKKQFQNDSLVLAAYNAGPTLVSRLKRIPRIPETINYVKKVTSLYNYLQQKMSFVMHDSIAKSVLFPSLTGNASQNKIPNSLIIKNQMLAFNLMECTEICEAGGLLRWIFTS